MAHVRIGNRIINLNQIVYAQLDELNGRKVLYIVFEQPERLTIPLGERPPRPKSLNMTVTGDDAVYVWEKLSGIADTWELPSHEKGAKWPSLLGD